MISKRDETGVLECVTLITYDLWSTVTNTQRVEVSELGCVTLITHDVCNTVTNTQRVEVSELGCVTLITLWCMLYSHKHSERWVKWTGISPVPHLYSQNIVMTAHCLHTSPRTPRDLTTARWDFVCATVFCAHEVYKYTHTHTHKSNAAPLTLPPHLPI